MAGAVHLGPPAEEREQGNSLTPSWLQDFFPSGLGDLLQLSEADARACDSPWCEPHPQTSPGAVPAVEGALGSPVPTLQAEHMFPGWVLCVSKRSVPKAQIPSRCYIRFGDAYPLGITTFPGLPFPGEGI